MEATGLENGGMRHRRRRIRRRQGSKVPRGVGIGWGVPSPLGWEEAVPPYPEKNFDFGPQANFGANWVLFVQFT